MWLYYYEQLFSKDSRFSLLFGTQKIWFPGKWNIEKILKFIPVVENLEGIVLSGK